MKKLLVVFAAMLVGVSILSANPMCVLPLTIPFSTLATPVYTPLCNLGQLTVSFAAVPNPATTPPALTGYFLSTDPLDPPGTKVLQFNPALVGSPSFQDVILLGNVQTSDGGPWITQVTLAQSTSSLNSTQETLCAVAPVSGICPGSSVLGTLDLIGTGRTTLVLNSPVSQLWFVKDVFAAQGTSFSILQQRFTVPEPMSFLLIGSGLLGLGILRRRAVRK